MNYLFFDDFLVHRLNNVVRRYHQPAWRRDCQYIDPKNAFGPNGGSVVPRADGRGFLMYYSTYEGGDNPDATQRSLMAMSDDGLHWRPMSAADGMPDPFDPISAGDVTFDPDDADPSCRYKSVVLLNKAPGKIPLPGAAHDGGEWGCYVKCSPDGLRWTIDPRHLLFRGMSDTVMMVIRNAVTGNFQVMMRAGLGNRRIFMVESPDLKQWTAPRLILNPAPPDPRGTWYYGMPQFRYGDIYLGFLQIYQTTDQDPGIGMMMGTVTSELAFSYDGLHWSRTRQPFMPLLERGEYGGASMYGQGFVDTGGDTLLVYATACLEEHHRALARPTNATPIFAILSGTIRRDGFVGIASVAGPGEVATRQIPINPDVPLTLNIRAPLGGVFVQISDDNYKPLPGYSFAECQEIRGDFMRAAPRWTAHSTLHEAVRQEKFVRVQVRLDHAELFSMGLDIFVNPYVGHTKFGPLGG